MKEQLRNFGVENLERYESLPIPLSPFPCSPLPLFVAPLERELRRQTDE